MVFSTRHERGGERELDVPFDHNIFKRSVKDWMKSNPDGSLADLVDFCEELIPPQSFSASRWIVDQTVSWYKHILAHREMHDMVAVADEEF